MKNIILDGGKYYEEKHGTALENDWLETGNYYKFHNQRREVSLEKKNNAFVLTTEGREEISERKKWGKGLKAKKTAHAKVLRWNKPEVLKKGKNASVSEVPWARGRDKVKGAGRSQIE